MARVNVETRALAEGRFFNFMNELDMSRAEAIGTLVLFWHDTQERQIWKGPRELLIKYIPFLPDSSTGVFDSLLKHDYISACDDGDFIIHGNKKHIEALEERKEQASRGGIASGASRREKSNNINKNEVTVRHVEAAASSSEPNSIQFNSIQSNTIHKNKEQPLRFDFESLYQKYPRKLGKAKGLQICKTQIKTESDYQDLSTAIDRYCKYIQAQGTDEKFVKHFSTFMGSWRDWLDPAAGSADIKRDDPFSFLKGVS